MAIVALILYLFSLTLIAVILREVRKMSVQLDELTAQVSSNTDVIESAVVLIQNIAAQLAEAGTDPVKLAALRDTLRAEDEKLAAAVAANTPAAPPVG